MSPFWVDCLCELWYNYDMEEKREKRIRQITIELSIAWGLISWFFLFFYVNFHIYPEICPWYTVLTYNLIFISNTVAYYSLLLIREILLGSSLPLFVFESICLCSSLLLQIITFFYVGKLSSWFILHIMKKRKQN